MKNILIVNAYSEIAGPNIALRSFIEEITNESDYRFFLVFPKKSEFESLHIKKNVKILYLPTFPLNKSIYSYHWFIYFINLFRGFFIYIYVIKKYKICLLHNNSSATIIQSLAAKFCNIKIVYHIREIWGIREQKLNLLYKFIYKISDTIICVSKEARDKNFHFIKCNKKNKLIVLYDCVSKNFFNPSTNYNDKKNELTIISCIGRLTPIKGQDIFIESINYIKNKYFNINFKVYIIGDIPVNNPYYENYKKELHDLIKKYNLTQCIELVGFEQNVEFFLGKSKILVLPSRISEGLGIVLLEGMITQNLVITSNIGGQKEIVEVSKSGLLFKNEDYVDLAEKIYFSIINYKNFEDNIKNGVLFVESFCRPKVYLDNLLNIYDDLLMHKY